MKPSNVAKALAVAIANNHNILLVGPPGVGKTDLIKQAAAAAEFRLLISHPVVSDPTDYKGMPWVVSDGSGKQVAKFLPFSQLRFLVETKVPTVFLLDDMGQAPPLVQAASMQLLLARAIDDIEISPLVTFVACTNRREDKAGVQGILEPVKSRFVSIIEVEPDVEDWAKWGIENKIPFKVISLIRWRPALLCSFKPTRDMTNSPSPRSVHNVCKIIQANYPKELEFELIKGAAGEAWAVEYQGFSKYEDQIPNVNKILQDPDKGEVVPEAHLTYALCGALAERATVITFPNIVRYADRLRRENKSKNGSIIKPRPEFGIMLIKDCLLKDAKLRKNPTFITWQLDNKDIIL